MFIGVLMTGLPFSMAVTLLLYLPSLLRNRRRRPVLRHLALYAFWCFCLLAVYATLLIWFLVDPFPFPPPYYFLNLAPFDWLWNTYEMGWERMAGQLILNILMFVPVGMLLPVVFRRMRSLGWAALGALGFTVAIETVQYFIGRSADIDDVIMNVLGGLIGYSVFALCNRLLRDKLWWRKMLGTAVIR